jgi:hypothetical protein
MPHQTIHLCISILFSVLMSSSQASVAEKNIQQLYHSLSTHPASNMVNRLDVISQHWLHRPYELFALGEGAPSPYDEGPRYRTDAFDCETYVDTVLAVALANNLVEFKQCMNRIRYANGTVSFLSRNHFMSLDWNINNQRQGFIRDITKTIVNPAHQPVFKQAVARIDKASWYAHLPLSRIRLPITSPAVKAQRLAALRAEGKHIPIQTATIAYLPFSALFNDKNQPVMFIFNQIPDGSIIEIVRPNWDLTALIGTHLNVSHLGFVFRKHHVLMFRQASAIYNHTIDVPLIDYLREARESPTIDGINIQIIVPIKPLANGCNARGLEKQRHPNDHQ